MKRKRELRKTLAVVAEATTHRTMPVAVVAMVVLTMAPITVLTTELLITIWATQAGLTAAPARTPVATPAWEEVLAITLI